MYDRSGQRKYLNTEERRAFLQVVEQESDLYKKTFCLTLFYAGCRISEALNLTWNRVDFSEKTVVIETLKQRKSGIYRAISLPDELLHYYKKITPKGQRIWCFSRTTAWRVVAEKMKLAEVSGVKACARGLRHSFATSYVSEGVPITTVQKWLGHKNLEVTSIYLAFSDSDERKLAKKIW